MADVIVDLESKNSKDLLNHGMRAFVLQDFQTAVQALGKASEILVAEHGDELHDSLGEIYLYYGKALVGLSRQEAEPLGDAIPTGDDEEESEDENAENDTNEEKAADSSTNGKAEEVDSSTNGKAEEVGSSTNGKVEDSSTNETTENLEVSQDADAADPTDLQVAWEVLELAKKIFEKKGTDGKKHLAETLTTLGEISLETEHFEEAIVDIKDGLSIQIEIFPKDSRKVAETYYNLGLAYSTNNQFDEGVEAFNKSLEYLNNRIKFLEESKDGDEEIKQIKELIPEILEKVADMKTCKEEAVKSLAEIAKQAEASEKNTAVASSSSSTKVSNINHLVKRKRKSEGNDDENPPKKVSQ